MRAERDQGVRLRRAAGQLAAVALLLLAASGCPPEAVIDKGSLSVRLLGAAARAESVWVTLSPYDGPIKEREVLGPEPLMTSFELIEPGVYWIEGRSYSAPPVELLQVVQRDGVEVRAGRRSTVLLALDEGGELDAGHADSGQPDAGGVDTAPADAWLPDRSGAEQQPGVDAGMDLDV